MDPQVLNNVARLPGLARQGLVSVPTLSLVTRWTAVSGRRKAYMSARTVQPAAGERGYPIPDARKIQNRLRLEIQADEPQKTRWRLEMQRNSRSGCVPGRFRPKKLRYRLFRIRRGGIRHFDRQAG